MCFLSFQSCPQIQDSITIPLTLVSKDIAVAPSVEEAGSNMIFQHQMLMLPLSAARKCDPEMTPWSENH